MHKTNVVKVIVFPKPQIKKLWSGKLFWGYIQVRTYLDCPNIVTSVVFLVQCFWSKELMQTVLKICCVQGIYLNHIG